MFLSFCHWLSSRPAIWREWLDVHLARFVQEHEYGMAVQQIGWKGWRELPVFGVVAFRNTDGTLDYRW